VKKVAKFTLFSKTNYDFRFHNGLEVSLLPFLRMIKEEGKMAKSTCPIAKLSMEIT